MSREFDEIFDFERSCEMREAGMSLAANNRPLWLERARDAACALARELRADSLDPIVNADMVQERLRDLYPEYDVEMLGPAAGSIFKESELWQATGVRTKSAQVRNHARDQHNWLYLGA